MHTCTHRHTHVRTCTHLHTQPFLGMYESCETVWRFLVLKYRNAMTCIWLFNSPEIFVLPCELWCKPRIGRNWLPRPRTLHPWRQPRSYLSWLLCMKGALWSFLLQHGCRGLENTSTWLGSSWHAFFPPSHERSKMKCLYLGVAQPDASSAAVFMLGTEIYYASLLCF